MTMSVDLRLQQLWYGGSCWAVLLMPLSWLFGLLVTLRRACFEVGVFRIHRLDKPVVVIGNLTVGGTGKTPLVIWLTHVLQAQGTTVAVITRGYGGEARSWPQRVTAESDPKLVGDESVLIAQHTGAIVVAGPDRVASGRLAIAAGAELIISDDGLQHYRLHRDAEVLVVDSSRGVGNGYLLPAGPLREPLSRLQQVDLIMINQRGGAQLPDLKIPTIAYQVKLGSLRAIHSGVVRSIDEICGQQVHVVTAIGHPHSFIAALEQCGLRVDSRIYPDHALLRKQDIEFGDDLPVLMTEKDAVKCQHIADLRHWAVTITVHFNDSDRSQLLMCVQQAVEKFAATH